MNAVPPSPPSNSADRERWQRWTGRWRRYGWLVAIASFGLGCASFFLIDRQARVAQGLIILLPLSWLGMLAEEWLESWEERRGKPRLSTLLLLRLAVQQVHQESFFFTLPFFIVTTNWPTWQGAFTSLLILAALMSMIDPFYHGHVAQRRWAYLAFHALAVFITVLTAGPMLWHMTTAHSLQLAAGLMALLSVPAMARVIADRRPWHWPLIIAACAGLGLSFWHLRWVIPPATLWVNESRVSQTLDESQREPGKPLQSITAEQAHRDGLYVWTAIRAPRGLHERVEHRWLHNGQVVDHITLVINGGREEGYRAWSYKQGFPEDPRGDWEIQVVTEGGQLIGVVRVKIT